MNQECQRCGEAVSQVYCGDCVGAELKALKERIKQLEEALDNVKKKLAKLK